MVNKKSKQLILHVIDSLEVGGAEKLLVNTIDALPEYNHVICYLGGVNKFSEINNVIRIICLEHNSNSKFFKTVFKLRRIIEKCKPILVHAHLLKSTWVSRFASLGKCPLIFTIHNKLSDDAFKVNKLSYYFEKVTYRKNQSIIGVSEEVIKDYNKWIGIKGKADILYNLVEEKFFKVSNTTTSIDGQLKLVAVGNLRRQKNYLNLLKAFTFLRSQNITLDIYGGGDEFDSLQRFISENNLPIKLRGKVQNIDEVMGKYDAFILPSLFEGYGIAVVEAMAAGLPVILSDISVFKEVTNSDAIYFDPLNPESISQGITTLNNMPENEKNAFKEKMRRRAIEVGSPELFKKNILRIYDELIKSNFVANTN